MNRRRWATPLIGVVLTLGLTACSGSSSLSGSADLGNASALTVPLPDGRSVVCVIYDDASYGTNLSCDWEHAK